MHWARRLGRKLPRSLRTTLVLTLYAGQVLRRIRGVADRECPCCGFVGRFAMFGHPPRYDARCPSCGSNERQRLIVLALERRGLLREGDRALYFTPEPVLSDYLHSRVGQFQSLNLKAPDSIMAADGAFDVILASNVLEHAKDDHKALAELRRVLAPEGWLIVTVPLIGGWDETYENAPIQTEEGRMLHFGERNHMRYYGRDILARMEEAGFSVEPQVATGEDSVRYSLIRGDYVFLAQLNPAAVVSPRAKRTPENVLTRH